MQCYVDSALTFLQFLFAKKSRPPCFFLLVFTARNKGSPKQMSSRKRSSDNSTPAKKRRTDASSKKAGAKKNSASSSSTASQPKYAMVTSDGDKTGGTGDQSVKGIFKSLEYGPAPESQGAFNAWLDDHGRKFGHFINNEWYDAGGRGYYETTAPATGEVLAKTIQGDKDDVDYAVGCARKAHGEWSTLAPHVRARYMYAIARNVQKHARLLSVCEAVDNGKTIREVSVFLFFCWYSFQVYMVFYSRRKRKEFPESHELFLCLELKQ